MISRDATLAFTQAALALANVPRDVGRAAEYEIHVIEAVKHLQRVLALLGDGEAPDVRAVAKFIVELEAANM